MTLSIIKKFFSLIWEDFKPPLMDFLTSTLMCSFIIWGGIPLAIGGILKLLHLINVGKLVDIYFFGLGGFFVIIICGTMVTIIFGGVMVGHKYLSEKWNKAKLDTAK